MGTVVFPDARLKVFLTASAEARAERRHKQLIAKGISVTIEGLLRDIREVLWSLELLDQQRKFISPHSGQSVRFAQAFE